MVPRCEKNEIKARAVLVQLLADTKEMFLTSNE